LKREHTQRILFRNSSVSHHGASRSGSSQRAPRICVSSLKGPFNCQEKITDTNRAITRITNLGARGNVWRVSPLADPAAGESSRIWRNDSACIETLSRCGDFLCASRFMQRVALCKAQEMFIRPGDRCALCFRHARYPWRISERFTSHWPAMTPSSARGQMTGGCNLLLTHLIAEVSCSAQRLLTALGAYRRRFELPRFTECEDDSYTDGDGRLTTAGYVLPPRGLQY